MDAVVRNLEVIGEASKYIPEEIRQKYPQVPWKSMIGLRNILIHEYFGIDEQIIWEIVSQDFRETKPLIENILVKVKND
nr:HepT-like ribonuclease domain-containing protein [Seinonella peptonophila]